MAGHYDENGAWIEDYEAPPDPTQPEPPPDGITPPTEGPRSPFNPELWTMWDAAGHDPNKFIRAYVAKNNLKADQSNPNALASVVDALNAVWPGHVAMDQADEHGHLGGIIVDGVKKQLINGVGGWTDLTDWPAESTTQKPPGMAIDQTYLKPFELNFGDFNPAYVDKSRLGTPPEFSFDQFQAPTGDSIQQDPSYQFRKDQAAGMLENSAAGRGLINSSGTLYDMLNLGQNMASQEYGNIWNRDFNLWGAKNQNKLNAFATNYGVNTDAYNRAENQYTTLRNTFYQNQNNPFQKLFQVAGLGANAAAG